ncbi:MAG: thiamine-phosphate kinase [Porticoccaceae bacterium]|nr:thiamine-phosphate kinase [Porticoccaceae bacterium]HLS99102.1 thiamine-phosphate kinase [Porticoccaceae bacterium]
MALHEFDLIRRFFTGIGGAGPDIALGVGDDCALLDPPPGCQLAISTDTLVEGVHFPVACDPEALAGRALRVNLSDLAAMGAEPLGFQLALTLPSADEVWLAAFSRGLARDAGLFGCPLMGGDTTRGPLAITVTVIGTLPAGAALRRGGAGAGDLLYVTGTLGDARGALDVPGEAHLAARYWRPEPRLAAGRLLRQFASAALDVSDGLAQDAGHIAAASGLGCRIEADRLPLSAALVDACGRALASRHALTGGDDYELCFSVPPGKAEAMEAALAAAGEPVTRIGAMVPGAGVLCVDGQGEPITLERSGYAHF